MAVKKKTAQIDIAVQSDKDKEHWKSATPANYEAAIWTSILDYVHRSQLDIAYILFKFFMDEYNKDKNFVNKFIAKNISFRLLQLYYENLDLFYIVCKSIIDKYSGDSPVYKTFGGSTKAGFIDFFQRCAEGKLTDEEVALIWGLGELVALYKKGIARKEKTASRIKRVIDDVLTKEKSNFKIYADKCIEVDEKTSQTYETSSFTAVSRIKHGFRGITYNNISKKFLDFEPGEIAIIDGLNPIKDAVSGKTKEMLKFGFLSKPQDIPGTLEIIVKQIEDTSKRIETFAELQLIGLEDPIKRIALLDKRGVIKLERNMPCPCGNGKKYKNCHYERV